MAVMAADGALGLGVRLVARYFSDVSPTDEGVFIFSVLYPIVSAVGATAGDVAVDTFPGVPGIVKVTVSCLSFIDSGLFAKGAPFNVKGDDLDAFE